MPKILKNPTGIDRIISDTGQTISGFDELLINPTDYGYYAQSQETLDYVSGGLLVVNDGLIDLPVDEAIPFLSLSETAKGIRFDPAGSSLTATNVEDAIKQVTVTGGDSFPWNIIPIGLTVIVPQNKQMIVYQELEIRLSGELELLGELVVIE
jgi:hypothetical protein